jgi:hypothetical protein
VAAWISAETGMGPSMASGSQICKPNCDDLLKQHIQKPKKKNNTKKKSIKNNKKK